MKADFRLAAPPDFSLTNLGLCLLDFWCWTPDDEGSPLAPPPGLSTSASDRENEEAKMGPRGSSKSVEDMEAK